MRFWRLSPSTGWASSSTHPSVTTSTLVRWCLFSGRSVPNTTRRSWSRSLRSEARRVFGRYTPEEIYSTKREIVEREIREGLATKIEGKHIVLEAILIRDVELPDAIRRAIDQKLAAEQEVLKMKYVLEVSKATSDEKRIDAQGIADYNHTIATSLSPPILEFERIQQLNKLAASPNAKTVVIGQRAGDAPVLLSTPTGSR